MTNDTTNDTTDESTRTGIVPVLTYEDIEAGHDYLVQTFGFTSGGLHRTDDGTVVHGEVRMGDSAVWLHRVAPEHEMASPRGAAASHGGLSVIVADVDGHYAAERGGGRPDRQRADRPGLRPARVRRARPREPPLLVRHASRPEPPPPGAQPATRASADTQRRATVLRPPARVARAGRVWRASRATRISTTTSGARPLTPRTSRSAAAIRLMRRRDARAAESPRLLERLLGHEGCGAEESGGLALIADVVAVEGEHVGVSTREGGEHLDRRQPAGVEHPVQDAQRRIRLAPSDGIGQLVSRYRTGLPEVGLQIVGRDPRPFAVGRTQRSEQTLDAGQVLAHVGTEEVDGRWVEFDRTGAEVLVEPCLAIARFGGGHLDDHAVSAHGPHEWRRDRPAAAHQHEHGARERITDHLDQTRHVRREQAAGVAHHDHPAVDEEGRGEAGVDDGADVQVFAASSELLDDERVVTIARPARRAERAPPGPRGRDRPLEPDRSRRARDRPRGCIGAAPTCTAARAHAASLIAANASRARQVPLTSWARTIRQPHAMPRAAAPMDACATLGQLQVQDLAEERLVGGGQQERVAEAGQGRRGAEKGERLLGRLAQIESGVEDDALGRDTGPLGACGPIEQERAHLGDDVVVVRVGVGHAGGEPDVRGDHGGTVPPPPPPRSRGRPCR